MEDLLDLYEEPYDPKYPVVCFDEKSKQLLANTHDPQPARPGRAAREDYEYKREGTRNLFMFIEPKGGYRHVEITEARKIPDFAKAMKWLVDEGWPESEKIRLVVDNLNTHRPASLYAVFAPDEARRIAKRIEWHYTPKHGSWLNMAEIELSVLSRECLNRRIASAEILKAEVGKLAEERNHDGACISWQFTTEKARSKFQRLYPVYQNKLN